MSGNKIIGNRYVNPNKLDADKSTPETRNLSRFLKLFGNPDEAAAALTSYAKDKKPGGRCLMADLDRELNCLRKKSKRGWVGNTEAEMANAVQRAINNIPVENNDVSSSKRPLNAITRTGKQTSLCALQSSLVSDDSEGAGDNEEEARVESEHQVLAVKDFWSHLIEHIHLCATSYTIRTQGSKKTYEVYRLAAPTLPLTNLEEIRSKVLSHFLSFYVGSPCSGKFAMRNSDCRVYAIQRQEHLWIQINVGPSFDPTEEISTRRSDTKKFVAMIPHESTLLALTAGRAASGLTLTRYVLSALEFALTCNVAGGYGAKDASSQRLEDLSGSDPHELLRSAQAIDAKNVVGRFASFAAAGSSIDPISEMYSAATESLLDRQNEKQRLEVGAKHGRKLANLSILVESEGKASLVASNQAGTHTIVDHSSALRSNRKRARDEEFGSGEKDMPVRTCVRWDWKGETVAAAACWEEGNSSSSSLPSHKFKCRVAMRGTDVFAGMRALMEGGFMTGPLPPYVKDAAFLGEGGIISVDDGEVRTLVDKPDKRG